MLKYASSVVLTLGWHMHDDAFAIRFRQEECQVKISSQTTAFRLLPAQFTTHNYATYNEKLFEAISQNRNLTVNSITYVEVYQRNNRPLTRHCCNLLLKFFCSK